MDHLRLRVGSRLYLLADPARSSLGKIAAYGILIHKIDEVIRTASALNAAVYLVRPRHPLNSALFHLECNQVEIVGRRGIRAALLYACWRLSAPVRAGTPVMWCQKELSGLLLPLCRGLLLRSASWGKPWRRLVKRSIGPVMNWCQTKRNTYASRVAARWRRVYKEASEKGRKAAREGKSADVRIQLSKEFARAAAAQAERLGVRSDTTLVSLHVRESGYRPALGLHQRSDEVKRNARIETYAGAIDFLVGRGYTVVRIGDATMRPLNRTGLIDLATSPLRTDALELGLIERSHFFITSDSGPYFLTRLLGIPCLAVNVLQFAGYSIPRSTDRFICKIAVDRTSGRALSVEEMLTTEYARQGLDVDRYEHLENSPADLCDAVREMVDVLTGASAARTDLQRAFDDRLTQLVRDYEGRRVRTSLVVAPARGTICHGFAARYYKSARVAQGYGVSSA